MGLPFKYGNPLFFRTPIWTTLPSDAECSVLIKPISYSTITSSNEIVYMKQQDDALFKHETLHTLLDGVVLKVRGAIGFPSIASFLSQLSPTDLTSIYKKVLSISTLTKEQLDALDQILDIQFNPQFSDDSWDCTTCQSKGLDYSRGCGFLDKDKRDSSPILPRISGKRLTECPIASLDAYVLNKASLCHSMYISGLLPEDGGIGDQTEWFVRTALLYKRKVAEAERSAMEAQKKK